MAGFVGIRSCTAIVSRRITGWAAGDLRKSATATTWTVADASAVAENPDLRDAVPGVHCTGGGEAGLCRQIWPAAGPRRQERCGAVHHTRTY
jgi:hypothetical protein